MPLVSVTLTVPVTELMVKLTIIVLPAATPPAGTVTLMVVPVDVELFWPILVSTTFTVWVRVDEVLVL